MTGPDSASRVYYYLEYDGMVFLVEREGRLCFPREKELPCPHEARVEMRFEDATVHFCTPRLERFPREWYHKDHVPAMANVDPLVHRAINATLVREVTGAIVLRAEAGKEEMLLVKASRGFTKGMWNMPGGFVTYGETPEESIVREVEEETGLTISPRRLLGVYTKRFSSPYFMRAHVFLAHVASGELRLAPDEIAEAEWMPIARAYEATLNPFTRAALDKLQNDNTV